MRFQSTFLHCIDWLYSRLIKWASNLQSLFLLYMRITWGFQFVLTGWKKIHGIEETAELFTKLNISYPYFSAYFAGWFEFLCGICLFVGFASRLASIPLIIIMIVALSTAHAADISNFRFLFQPLSLVRQTPYPFLITSLMVLVFGPGRISIDAWLKRWSQKQPKY